jgi:hypothetical protein
MGGAADYSLASIEPVLGRIAERVEVEDVAPPDGAPAWVGEAMRGHRGGFRVVAASSRPLVLRAAFYLGQSFVISRDGLRWDIGRRDRAEVRQPVVAGFPAGDDLPVLTVAEAVLLGREPAEALAGWMR